MSGLRVTSSLEQNEMSSRVGNTWLLTGHQKVVHCQDCQETNYHNEEVQRHQAIEERNKNDSQSLEHRHS